MGIILWAILALLGLPCGAAETTAPALALATWFMNRAAKRRGMSPTSARSARLMAARLAAEALAPWAKAVMAEAKGACLAVAQRQSVAEVAAPTTARRRLSAEDLLVLVGGTGGDSSMAAAAAKDSEESKAARRELALARQEAKASRRAKEARYDAEAAAQRAAARRKASERRAARRAHDLPARKGTAGTITVGGSPTRPEHALRAAVLQGYALKAAAAKAEADKAAAEAKAEADKAAAKAAKKAKPTPEKKFETPAVKADVAPAPVVDAAAALKAAWLEAAWGKVELERALAPTSARRAILQVRKDLENELTPAQPAQARPLGILEKGAIPALRRKAPAVPARKGTQLTGMVSV